MMCRVRSYFIVLSWMFVSLWSGPAAATSAFEVERAASSQNWPLAARLAETAIAEGGLALDELVSLYRVLGTAQAHLGNADPARRAFMYALALDPGLRLRPEESVEVRSPFMEARGFWSLHPRPLEASAQRSEDGGALVVTLTDPAALAARVLVRLRAGPEARLVEHSLAPATTMLVSLPAATDATRLEYTLALIDENGNRLWERDSRSATPQTSVAPQAAVVPPRRSASPRAPVPAEIPAPPPAPLAVRSLPAADPEGRTDARSPVPYYVGATLSFAVGAAGAVVGGLMHAERQQLAARWNRGDCNGEGTTRGEICRGERERITRYERLAIGMYGAGAAGLALGTILLLVAPSRDKRGSALRCGTGPGTLGVGCRGTF